MIDIFYYDENGTPWVKMTKENFQAYTVEVVMTSAENHAAAVLRKYPKAKKKK
jgi:response regulator of citrate/malate metabolism